MEIFNIKNLSFKYPKNDTFALHNVNISVFEGEILLVCGKSGCGKTTLLSHLKPVMTPYGEKSGEILFDNTSIENLSELDQASKIGYVLQNPHRQIVTDTVWKEMAFGLENLGIEYNEMHRRIAETAYFFGIDSWFDRDISTLSGGEKQLLNLACVMVMQPSVLILDEPTASLDPIAATEFLNAIYRINEELGTTIIISEHRIEQIFPHRNSVAYMEDGEIKYICSPSDIAQFSKSEESKMFLPIPAKLYIQTGGSSTCPIDIKSGRKWLFEFSKNYETKSILKNVHDFSNDTAVELKSVYFRYSKQGTDILKDCNLKIPTACIYSIIGGNGSGKTTLLKVIAGIQKQYSGKVITDKKLAYLPQEASLLFACDSVEKELLEICDDKNLILKVAKQCDIEDIFASHPYDISVGQAQKVALAKVLLTGADILLLDEITRGLDPIFKKNLGHLLRELCKSGKTIILVSHDIEFCSEYSDIVGMFFNGEITSQGTSQEFFTSNNFYTTQVSRMSKGILSGCVNSEDIIDLWQINK